MTNQFEFKGFYGYSGRFPTNMEQLGILLPAIDAIEELKVLIFILARTNDSSNMFTVDEIAHGYELQEERMEEGIGLSESQVLIGLKLAIHHGYVIEGSFLETGQQTYALNIFDSRSKDFMNGWWML